MTVFVLVGGVFTGSWVWAETARGLTAAGAGALPVALSGLDGPDGGTGPGGEPVDLETHIADVVAAIDAADGREVVLVGHDYGIHPVLGAADRRAERVARIVYLDAGMPRNGVPALAAVPDQSLRERLAEDGGGADVPPPGRDEWQRWGSTAGLSDAALDRLTALAAPQPLGTLLQPLRLTGAVAAVPTTGVLCTGSGTSIDMLQTLVGFGDPALQALTDPRVSFFELGTGHWPMLSRPAELADALLRAAAGEGRRLKPTGAAEPPPHLRPFLLDVPELPRERTGNVDLHLPPGAGGPRPAVVFVHGGPVPAEARPTPRDWPTLTGYARCAALGGVVGVTLDHRLHAVTDYERAAADVRAAVDLVRADARVDADRIALCFFSGGGPLSADWLAAPPEWLRCVAAVYPVLAPLPSWGLTGSRFAPARAVADAGELPLVLVRVGREMPEIAATVEEFLTAAEECGANVEVVDVPNGQHGFETLDHTEESREAVRRTLESVLAHLAAG
ncbi:alpha/beta fold hydrolase [Streptomyces sp. NPDC006610]|uniref:alpha/beta hydrolase n=1 Tax=Streptomyces sp. NPDC006610 TaxID=3154584 RepID=UPI0033A4805C